MAMKKASLKRGRPKSAKTLEMERINAMLKNPPAHIPPMRDEEKQWLIEFIKNSEEAQKNILEGHSPLIPHSLIYDLESCDEESEALKASILEKYREYLYKEALGKINGSEETAAQADTNARRLWKKNSALAKRIQSGNLTPNGAAKIIFDDWKNKGIEVKKPSIRTITNWYKRIRCD